jgi:DNA-binding transcriptional regulator YdaS (Cro superfamily)
MDSALKAAVTKAGGVRALARLLNITHAAILQWGRVPTERIIEIERVTGIPRERLRPELYRQPVTRSRASAVARERPA